MVIVNLTTINSRLDLCSATVWSILNQEFLPDKIIIWISNYAYMADRGIKEIPEWVGQFNSIKNIVHVEYVTNTGPYRKIIPALRKYPLDILVYADDDVIYGRLWLKKLILQYKNHEGKFAVASRVRKCEFNFFGKQKSYNLLPLVINDMVISSGYIITGVGGCVLNAALIKDKYIFLDDYIRIAPRTDDLWISKILELSGTGVSCCPDAMKDVQEIEHQNNALNHVNVVQSSGHGLKRLINKARVFFLGYFGVLISNNDFSQRSINAYFDEME